MPQFSQEKLKESRNGTRNLFSFGFKGMEPSSPGGPPTSGGASGALHVNCPNNNAATSPNKEQSPESDDDVQQRTPASSSSNGKRKLASLDPINKGPAVDHVRLEPHQAGVFERMKAGMAHPSFAGSRAKLGEIAREAAKARGMGDEASTDDVLRQGCGEYRPQQVLALDVLRGRPLTDEEMLQSGIEKFELRKDNGVKEVNYMNFYAFRSKQAALDMIDKWQFEMGVGTNLCGALRAKVNEHDWDSREPLRLGISGEGLPASAHKYAKGLQNPPTPARARQPRQVNGRVANDGPAWNVPAGLVLAGAGAIDTVETETYVWKSGDPERSWREVHEAIGALVFLGGLVWSRESLCLNQKVGGTFTDDQRAQGGRYGVDEEVWNDQREPTAEEQRLMDKKRKDSSAAGAASSGTDCNQIGAGPNQNRAAKKRKNIAVDAGDEGAEETSSTPASKPTEELGLCLGLSSDGAGLVAKLKSSIDLETGAILADPALWCDKPKFVQGELGQRGLTLRESKWQEDETGCLVLGYHNTNGRDGKTPACVASTVPVVKLKKVLDMRTDTPALLESLEAISTLFSDQNSGSTPATGAAGDGEKTAGVGHEYSTLDARRSLREDLERQNYNLSACFQKSFERLRDRLEGLDGCVVGLEEGCASISERLSAADASMRQFTLRAEALRDQRTQLGKHADQVSLFLRKFQLTPEEVEALSAPLEPDQGKRFFSALLRLKTVRASCGRLVGSSPQSAGFELLEQLSQHQETAYERLYLWVQDRCQTLEEETPAADVTLQAAVRCLRDRPLYYVHCQESIVNMRRKLLVQRFVMALTSGQSSVRPIEMQAHDPVRYVGDILAWVHQAVAMEKELVAALFGGGSSKSGSGGGNGDGRSNGHAGGEEGDRTGQGGGQGEGKEEEEEVEGIMSAEEVLCKVLQGIARPLQSRVSTVLESVREAGVGYRLLNLLAFYKATVGQLAGLESPLMESLSECRKNADDTFRNAMKREGDRLVASPPAYTADLSALPAALDGAKRLTEVLQVHSTSLVPAGEPESDVQPVLTGIMEPLLRACRLSADGLDPSDGAVFMLNNIDVVREALVAHAHTEKWTLELTAEMDKWLGVLVRHQADKVLERCGVAQAVRAAEAAAERKGAVNDLPGLQERPLSAVLRSFYSSLFTLVMPDFERLRRPGTRADARRSTALLVAEAHETVHRLVSREDSGYEDRSFLLHTPEQVRMLLDCD
eukprot:g5962.t1